MSLIVGDTVEHYLTGRRGKVLFIGTIRMVIEFDTMDGGKVEEFRWITAFEKVNMEDANPNASNSSANAFRWISNAISRPRSRSPRSGCSAWRWLGG